MRDLESALSDIRAIVKSRDTEALSAIILEMEVIVLTVDVLPDMFVHGLSEILQDEASVSVNDSWKIVKFVYDSWEQLTSDQREHLRSVLIRSFDKYSDWMGAFVTVEILGERFADERALDDLAELATTAKLPERAAVPHGMELVAKSALDQSLRALAIKRLEDLASSSIKEVKEEALLALRHLGHGPR